MDIVAKREMVNRRRVLVPLDRSRRRRGNASSNPSLKAERRVFGHARSRPRRDNGSGCGRLGCILFVRRGTKGARRVLALDWAPNLALAKCRGAAGFRHVEPVSGYPVVADPDGIEKLRPYRLTVHRRHQARSTQTAK